MMEWGLAKMPITEVALMPDDYFSEGTRKTGRLSRLIQVSFGNHRGDKRPVKG
jgi:hypothetical protein